MHGKLPRCENRARVRNEGEFRVERTVDPDGFVRLSAVGELDHVAADDLRGHLSELKDSREPVRLDLSRLEFIDSSGVRGVLLSVRDAARDRWRLEVDREVSWQ